MRDHKSLRAWEEAHKVVNAALDLAESHWRPALAAVYTQLASSAISVQINIAEGYALGTRALFVRHLRIAYGSAMETGDLLELLAERLAIPVTDGNDALNHCRASQRLLLGLLRKYGTTP
jgi:four helix bundle protein